MQALPVAFQVKTGDGDFPVRNVDEKLGGFCFKLIPGYDAVNSGSAVSYHEYELPIGEQLNKFKVIKNS